MNRKIEDLYFRMKGHHSLLDLNYYIGSQFLIDNYTFSELEKVYTYSIKKDCSKDIKSFLIYTIVLIVEEDPSSYLSSLKNLNLKEEILKELKNIEINKKKMELASNPENARVESLIKKEKELEKELKNIRYQLFSTNQNTLTDTSVIQKLKKFKAKLGHFIY